MSLSHTLQRCHECWQQNVLTCYCLNEWKKTIYIHTQKNLRQVHNSSSNNRRRKKKVWHFLNWNSQLQNTQCSKKHSECFTANPALKHSSVEFHKFGHGNRIAGVGSYHFSVHDAYDGVRWWVRWFHRCHWYSHFQMKMYAIQSFSSFLFPCGRECQLSWILVNRFEIVNLLSCLS